MEKFIYLIMHNWTHDYTNKEYTDIEGFFYDYDNAVDYVFETAKECCGRKIYRDEVYNDEGWADYSIKEVELLTKS